MGLSPHGGMMPNQPCLYLTTPNEHCVPTAPQPKVCTRVCVPTPACPFLLLFLPPEALWLKMTTRGEGLRGGGGHKGKPGSPN